MDSADWELEPGTGRAALGLGTSLASFASTSHGSVSERLRIHQRREWEKLEAWEVLKQSQGSLLG